MDKNRDGHLTEEEFLRVVSKTTSSRKCWRQTWSNNTRILTITWWIFNTKFLAHKKYLPSHSTHSMRPKKERKLPTRPPCLVNIRALSVPPIQKTHFYKCEIYTWIFLILKQMALSKYFLLNLRNYILFKVMSWICWNGEIQIPFSTSHWYYASWK